MRKMKPDLSKPWFAEKAWRAQWMAHGFPCLALRGPLGGWCGYVALGTGHPAFGKTYSDSEIVGGLHVHGGVTFSDEMGGGGYWFSPREVDRGQVWLIGFDCAHYHDSSPITDFEQESFRGVVRADSTKIG